MVNTGRSRDLLRAIEPNEWPSGPQRMSVSVLSKIEGCPRKWGLTAAEYHNIWDGVGYPPRFHTASLIGRVVHHTVAAVIKQLSNAGCSSVNDPSSILVMKTLGGYTALVRKIIAELIKSFAGNPRATDHLESEERRLLLAVPKIRSHAQSLLANVKLQSHRNLASLGTPSGKNRRPLISGSYPEILLEARELGWHGIADLLTISSDRCEIRDFKTGLNRDEHEFQLRVYALLWWRDVELNPGSRLADTLVLDYPGTELRFPAPNREQLEALERDLLVRTRKVLESCSKNPPDARVTVDNCRYCDVRQICSEYWRQFTRPLPSANGNNERASGDLQVVLKSQHGSSSWDGYVEAGGFVPSGTHVLLRTRLTERGFRPGARVRILDALISQSESEEKAESKPIIATMIAKSEAFVI